MPSTSTTNVTHAAAKSLATAGISYLPTGENKLPAAHLLPRDPDDVTKGTWKPLQGRMPTDAETEKWFGGTMPRSGLARIHGLISGNLETIDADTCEYPDNATGKVVVVVGPEELAQIVQQWEVDVETHCPGLIPKLTKIQTPGGGWHYVSRCDEPVDGNLKLAEVPGRAGEWLTLWETRGEGGYAVCPGTLEKFHPDHKLWIHVAGPALENVATITADERRVLLQAARMFTKKPERLPDPTPHEKSNGTLKPGDDFNQRTKWDELLQPRGWVCHHVSGAVGYWRRPGGTSPWSATTNHLGTDRLHVFSPNAGLEPGSHSKFGFYAHMDHGGDFAAAAKALVTEGYGEPSKNTASGDRSPRTPQKQTLLSPSPVREYEKFPVECLPASCRGLVRAGAAAIGCDAAMIGLPALAIAAGAVGNTRAAEVKAGWWEPGVIWGAVVGESGSYKSPALSLVVDPLEQMQAEALQEHQDELEAFQREEDGYRAALSEWKSKGKKMGEAMPTAPALPTCRRLFVSDITVEGLADRLQDNPRGLTCVRDELSGWFGSFDKYSNGKSGDIGSWLPMHSAKALVVDRKGTDRKMVFVRRAAVSIVGGIQPGILQNSLGKENFDNGLAARLLVVMPPKRLKKWNESQVSQSAQSGWATCLTNLYTLQSVVGDKGERAFNLKLTSGAKDVWVSFYEEFAERQAQATGEAAACLSKLEGYCARLAMIIQLMKWADGEGQGNEIEQSSMEAGVILCRWFTNEAGRVYTAIRETDSQRDTRLLLELIQARGGVVAPRDIQRACRKFRDSSDTAEKALQELVDLGKGKWVTTSTGGRPGSQFHLVTHGDGDRTSNFKGETGLLSPGEPENGQSAEPDVDEGNRMLACEGGVKEWKC